MKCLYVLGYISPADYYNIYVATMVTPFYSLCFIIGITAAIRIHRLIKEQAN